MRHFMVLLAMAAVALCGFGSAVSLAQDKAAAIAARRDTMKRQGEDLAVIQAFAKADGDQAAALAKAEDLLAIAKTLPALFPPGTSLAEFPGKTGAKPVIWQEWDKFLERPAALQAEEEKLAAAIRSGDRPAAAAALAETGKNGCGACHSLYRERLPE